MDKVEDIEARIDNLIELRDKMADLPRGPEWKDALMTYTGGRFAISTKLHALAAEIERMRPLVEAALNLHYSDERSVHNCCIALRVAAEDYDTRRGH